MQAGIDTARARLAALTSEIPPRIEIRPEAAGGFFGSDGPSFRDIVDAINPLNHLPVVSDLFAQATDHTPSTAARLIGGTVFGGPIGFVASLAGVIFESATGHSVAGAVVAALSGEEAPVALAANAAPARQAVASSAATLEQTEILDLFGASSPASAHQSYQKAQMRPYLDDVTVSELL